LLKLLEHWKTLQQPVVRDKFVFLPLALR
jgi:hypothetical protein